MKHLFHTPLFSTTSFPTSGRCQHRDMKPGHPLAIVSLGHKQPLWPLSYAAFSEKVPIQSAKCACHVTKPMSAAVKTNRAPNFGLKPPIAFVPAGLWYLSSKFYAGIWWSLCLFDVHYTCQQKQQCCLSEMSSPPNPLFPFKKPWICLPTLLFTQTCTDSWIFWILNPYFSFWKLWTEAEKPEL